MNEHVARQAAVDPNWANLDETMRFLTALRPSGPWNLMAISPGKPGIESVVLVDPKAARKWLADQVHDKNLHYLPNAAPKPTGAAGRPTKADVSSVEYLHVDIDLDKLPEGHRWYDLDLPARKAAALQMLDGYAEPGPPSLIVDTGGGLQGLWRLNNPTALGKDRYHERLSEYLANVLGGDPGTFTVAQPLRLPGTINFPNSKKAARGRVAVPARLLQDNAHSYDDADFEPARPRDQAAQVDIGDAEFIDDFEAFAARYALNDRIQTIIREGCLEEAKQGDNSRSGWVFDCATSLVRAKVPPEVIVGLLLDHRWRISESITEKGEHGAQRAAYRTVRNAMSAIGREMDSFDDEPLEAFETATRDDWAAWVEKNFEQIGQVDVATIPQTPWLVEGLLLYRDITLIGGRGGVGKSLHAWQIGVAVATGKPFAWWDKPLKRRRVLVISGEDDVMEVERRVSAACQSMKVDRYDLAPDFLVWKHRSIRLAVKDMASGKIERTELWRGVRWAVENMDIGLIIIDPLVKASGGFDESGNVDMDALFEEIRHLSDGHDCAVLIDDHFAKAGVGGDQAGIRGASAKVDACRIAITLTAMTDTEHGELKPPRGAESYVRFVDAKTNYSKKRGTRWLEFVDYPVGNGETRPALKARNFSVDLEFLDPVSWRHRDAFLELVRTGRRDQKHSGWPWCTTTSGQHATRLDVAAMNAFQLSQDQARAWITTFADEGLIVEVDWTSPSKNKSKVWALPEQATV